MCSNDFTISWNTTGTDIGTYVISLTPGQSLNTTVTSYRINGLMSNTNYHVRVDSSASMACVGNSKEMTVRTLTEAAALPRSELATYIRTCITPETTYMYVYNV